MVAGEVWWHATIFSDLVIAILSLRLDKESSGFLFFKLVWKLRKTRTTTVKKVTVESSDTPHSSLIYSVLF